jgi:hypothetical protein
MNEINKTPNPKMLRNCKAMGWEYLGDGIFAKGDVIGYFVERNFVKV